jgi:hypothetical protein
MDDSGQEAGLQLTIGDNLCFCGHSQVVILAIVVRVRREGGDGPKKGRYTLNAISNLSTSSTDDITSCGLKFWVWFIESHSFERIDAVMKLTCSLPPGGVDFPGPHQPPCDRDPVPAHQRVDPGETEGELVVHTCPSLSGASGRP